MENQNKIEENDFPVMYKLADKSSLQGQKRYIFLFRLELIVLVLGAFISLFPLDNKDYGHLLAILSAICFVCAIALTIYIKTAKLENFWYVGRAVAESIKTLTWRYVTKGEPYTDILQEQEIDKKFCNVLAEILKNNKDYLDLSLQDSFDNNQITPKMKIVRSLSFEQRKELYIRDRITDQWNWYKKKAKYNMSEGNKYFIILILLQLSAMIYSLYLIKAPELFNAVPLITGVASAFISWIQVKQFEELAQAYGTTAQEITLIQSQANHVTDENAFSVFIGDTENAFSREHTLWLARKDVFNYSKN